MRRHAERGELAPRPLGLGQRRDVGARDEHERGAARVGERVAGRAVELALRRQPRERPELGGHDHRPDDEHHRVGDDADRGDDRGEHHEEDVAEREVRALGGVGRHLFPDHRLRPRADRAPLRLLGRDRKRHADGVHRDGPILVAPHVRQRLEHDAALFARDVARDEVALRLGCHAAQVHDVDDGVELEEVLEDPVHQRGRHDNPYVKHRVTRGDPARSVKPSGGAAEAAAHRGASCYLKGDSSGSRTVR